MEILWLDVIFAIVLLLIVYKNVIIKIVILFGNVIKKMYYGIPFVSAENNINHFPLEIADIYKKHRHPIVGTNLFVINSVFVICNLEMVKCVLAKDFESFQNRGLFYNEREDPLSAILGTAEYTDWCNTKKKISPSFGLVQIKKILPQIKNMCNVLTRNLGEQIDINGETIEIIGLISCFTIDAIAKIAFGQNNSESGAQSFREMIMKGKQPYLQYPYNRFTTAYPKAARFLRMRKHSKEVTEFFVEYVSEIVKYRKENKNARYDDFIQSWIDEGLEIHRIAAVGFDLLSAGFADSTSTLAYCLYEMSLNKSIQNRAREEIHEILENEEFTYADLKKLRYIKQIIQEAERKYPVAGMAYRVATKPFTFEADDGNITIPCGMKVFIPIYGIHHDDKFYPNPEVFDPDRFTKESIKDRPQYAFLPFGAGPRQCIGYKFAEMIICIGIVTLLKKFKFSISPFTEIPIKFNEHKSTLHPKSGVTLKVQRI